MARPPLSAVDLIVPALTSVLVAAALDPGLWFRDATPALTDLPGHLLPPYLLREELLPRGQVQGWSFDWFAGFPVYRFYFLVPGLLAAGLGAIVGDALALRTASAAPLVLLPWALWAFGRTGGLGRVAAAGITVVGSSYILMSSHRIMGGNILSVAAGEFSYAWAVLFLVLHLGILLGSSWSGSRALWSGATLAAALLSHVVPVLIGVVAVAPFLLSRIRRMRILAAWGVAAVLTAFWTLPMVLSLGYVASPGWTFTPTWSDLFPLELSAMAPGAVYGVWALRRHTAVKVAVSLGAAAIVLAMAPQTLVMRARPLPLWYLAVHVLAGAGMAQALVEAWRRGPRRSGAGAITGLAAVALWLVVMVIRGADSSNWKETMEGLPARPGHEELQALVRRLEGLPAGRIHWEPGERLPELGGRHALGLIPLWTDHTTLAGLLAESAPLTELLPVVDSELSREVSGVEYPKELPTVPQAPIQATARLRMLGTRYLVTHSDGVSEAVTEAAGPPLARFRDLRLFDLGPVSLVEPLGCWTVVPEGTGFMEASLDWFIRWSPEAPFPIPAGSPLPAGEGGAPQCAAPRDESVSLVGDIHLGHEEIRFTVRETRVPVLVRVSHFPAWRADGASGPFPAGPRFMAVIPNEPEVTLRYGPDPAERAGWILTVAGVVLLTLVTAAPALRRRLPGDGPKSS